MAHGCREEASGQKTQNWSYYEANFLVEVWANVSYQCPGGGYSLIWAI